jgi:hypothetical protein
MKIFIKMAIIGAALIGVAHSANHRTTTLVLPSYVSPYSNPYSNPYSSPFEQKQQYPDYPSPTDTTIPYEYLLSPLFDQYHGYGDGNPLPY